MKKKRTHINEVESTTRMCLESDVKARADDSYLYYLVAEVYAIKQGVSLSGISARAFLTNVTGSGIPTYGSVARARRKLQELHPELRPSGEVVQARAELEDEYMEYAMR